jgi:2,4-dienoyl-CoA reductase-like NADH-dependent reductase (Old Yellow Enzyme family)
VKLFDAVPLRCGQQLRNRLALAPLTNKQSHDDGLISEEEIAFLARRAEGDFGLIETCATYVSPDGAAWEGELGIDRDECIPGLTRLASRLHAAGSKAIVQLFHGGARADRAADKWSASAFQDGVRAATPADIERTIAAFVDGAERAQRAGFDGVELHGAHGYVLSQFLSRTMNTRDDAWGGSLENRARFVRMVTRGVRKRIDGIVGVRLSLEDFGNAKGLDLDESLQVARWLADDGVDFIHASLWDVSKNSEKRPDQHVLPQLRAALPSDVRIITAGKIWTREDAEAALSLGADVVALGRSAILNPDWPRTVAHGEAPKQPPVTRAELGAVAVSPKFQQYLTNWKNFVAD